MRQKRFLLTADAIPQPQRRSTKSSIASSLKRSASTLLPHRGGTALAYPKPPSTSDQRPSTSVSPADHDIDAELEERTKVFKVLAALRDGHLPNNRQLDAIFKTMKESTTRKETDRRLTPDGQTVKKDLAKLVDSLRTIMVDKNGDEDLQQFVYHARHAAGVMKSKSSSISLFDFVLIPTFILR